ncbi:heme peroxidase [Pholiota conissans]|uniref:Peroxidase n=1 Tax=Pholiota conissans TaxID=109636 RepID=A0A9P6CY91_9AGAR|nr:heme peroxidase [Pholiota conissans]
MRGFPSLLAIVSLHGALLTTASAYQWPNPRYEALERFLFEGTDINDKALTAITNSCAKRAGSGSPVAAEWLRIAYHDSATYNITDGTGGLDASVYYELTRTENIGGGMATSTADFQASSNKYVSRSDLIALGTVWGVVSCGGPLIPFRPGRIDATAAGRYGVPQPQEVLSLATERFRLQGFNQSEMISLVACGHTLGGVRNTDFPSIVQIPGPTVVLKEFDGTDAFDSAGVAQYLNWTTQNPLITIRNTLYQNDLRIFQSDGNATMKSMNSDTAFNAVCAGLLERMINLVPNGVQLSDEIALIPFKVTQAQFNVQNGQLVFDVLIRAAVTAADQTSNQAVKSITMFWCDARGANAGCPGNTALSSSISHPTQFNDVLVSPVSKSLQTSFVEFELTVPIDATRGVGRFWFNSFSSPAARVIQDNGGAGYSLDDAVIFLPNLGAARGSGSVVFDVVVGVRYVFLFKYIHANLMDARS